MLTAVAATLLTITTAAPVVAPSDAAKGTKVTPERAGTLATALPTPGAWALMGMGGLALIRARRVKR